MRQHFVLSAFVLLALTTPIAATAQQKTGSCSATVYEHARFEGASWQISTNYTWVGSAWNDRISSIRITSGVWELYEHRAYEGARLTLSAGGHGYVGDAWNDHVSSLRCIRPTG